MLAAAWINTLFVFLFWLFFLAGCFVYTALVRQINARPEVSPDTAGVMTDRTFGIPEAGLAILLISFLLLNVFVPVSGPSSALSSRDLVANLVLIVVVLLILVGFLELRRLSVDRLAGFSKYGITRAITTGAALLLAAYPLISVADAITLRLAGSGSSKQSIVELFNGSQTMGQRVMIIILAVAVAPISEEFVFRFFLYGVLRRYVGRFAGLIFTALLFAAVHRHLPSFAPLFVLAVCFTLAYEWSGSILVSMTMHSVFNALSLFFLAFPQLGDQ